MKLQDHLSQDRIFFLKKNKKNQAIRELVESTCARVPTLDRKATLQAVEDRESIVSSWVAPGIAIPHARLSDLNDFVVAIGLSREGIVYESVDGLPVHLLILILGDAGRADQHILLLAEVARTFRSDATRQAVLSAQSKSEIYRILQNPETLGREIKPSKTSGITELVPVSYTHLTLPTKA